MSWAALSDSLAHFIARTGATRTGLPGLPAMRVITVSPLRLPGKAAQVLRRCHFFMHSGSIQYPSGYSFLDRRSHWMIYMVYILTKRINLLWR
jgi:hypothetical protein